MKDSTVQRICGVKRARLFKAETVFGRRGRRRAILEK
jgi:hypothetical protein